MALDMSDEIGNAISPVDCFTGFLDRRKCCRKLTCGEPVRGEPHYEPVLNLLLPQDQKEVRMQEIVDNFANDKINLEFCNGCDEETAFEIEMDFHNVPKHLFISVARSTMVQDKIIKIKTKLMESKTITFKQKSYKLREVIIHDGDSALSGHYLSVNLQNERVFSDQFKSEPQYYRTLSEVKRDRGKAG